MSKDLYCNDCPQLDKRDRNSYGEYYCNQKRKYVSQSSRACGYLDPEVARKEYHRAGWYLVEAITNRIANDEAKEIYATTKRLKDEYLVYTEEGQEFLKKYDEIGPTIALKLFDEPIEEIESLYNRFLRPCAEEIKNNNFDYAAIIYENMFAEVKERYGFEENVMEYIDSVTLSEIFDLVRKRTKHRNAECIYSIYVAR